MMPFKKILIANRGEVAVRILRACREMRIPSVAVFSDVDASSLHRRLADESYALGDPTPSQSYLNIPKIIAAAKQSGADAIHPGYGFLSENANFAEACEKEGITFIGPPVSAIRRMGDKIGARNFLKPHGIPLVPGTDEPVSDVQKVADLAREIGYPVLIKAAAGGGGKGMRVVHKEEDLMSSLEGAKRESKSAFGDDRVFVEKYLLSPRHVEFQVVGDAAGNIFHLFERECSIQRRHQKVIEETPSPILDDDLREKMGATAVQIAQLIDYRSLGTIEFILDQNRNFYFLEVNTRLQVEHPITEMVTGVDLVKMQIGIAADVGARFPRPGEGTSPLRQRGHAIECRICAEDPEKNFLPSIGEIRKYQEPRGEGIRVDSGVFEGWRVPFEYDPLLAKLIVYAPTRERAILKMIQALQDYKIEGVKTNIHFLRDLLRHPAFIAGETETGFIDRYFKNRDPGYFVAEDPFSPWIPLASQEDSSTMDRKKSPALAGRPSSQGSKRGAAPSDLTAPMPGQITKVCVVEGQKVSQGDPLVVMEAMKMEHSILASHDGVVEKIFYSVGHKVAMGEKLVELK